MRTGTIAADIDAYIAAAPADVQPLLTRMRATIAAAAPDAVESIAYGMPTFRQDGNLVHFGAFRQHIGFYPGPEAITAHAAQLASYVTSKGAIQLPLDAPLPLELVRMITAYRVQQAVAKQSAKTDAKSKTSAKTKAPAKEVAGATPRRKAKA